MIFIFIFSLLSFYSFSFWVRYGMMVIDTVMVVVNFVGLVLQFSSVVMFYYYTSTRVSVMHDFISLLKIFIFIFLY